MVTVIKFSPGEAESEGSASSGSCSWPAAELGVDWSSSMLLWWFLPHSASCTELAVVHLFHSSAGEQTSGLTARQAL